MKKTLIIFLRQFATLLTAGIPILAACETLESSQKNVKMRLLIYSLKRDLQAGHSLFATMQRYPEFDDITRHMVNLGEQTGRLATLLTTVATYQEKRHQQVKQMKQALLYPIFVITIAICITISLLIFVVPGFASLFSDAHVQLPLLTRICFQLSYLLTSYWWVGIFLIPLPFVLKHVQLSSVALPLVNTFFWKIFLMRFTHTLALSLTAGMPLHVALAFAANAAGGEKHQQLITQVNHSLATGLQLHQALFVSGAFPSLLIEMVKVGEESAKLPLMLNKAAEWLESEINEYLHTISTLFEPLIILILGVVIGGVVISMYLPIFKLGSTI